MVVVHWICCCCCCCWIIAAVQGLDEAVAGTSLLVAEEGENIAELEGEVMGEMSSVFKNVDSSGSGVFVVASTLGSLEALLVYLEECKIPVFAVSIGEPFNCLAAAAVAAAAVAAAGGAAAAGFWFDVYFFFRFFSLLFVLGHLLLIM